MWVVYDLLAAWQGGDSCASRCSALTVIPTSSSSWEVHKGTPQRQPTKEKIKDLWEMRATVKETQVQWVRRGLLAHGQEKR